ncbi:unnamed protein product [Camellia sinensis]
MVGLRGQTRLCAKILKNRTEIFFRSELEMRVIEGSEFRSEIMEITESLQMSRWSSLPRQCSFEIASMGLRSESSMELQNRFDGASI